MTNIPGGQDKPVQDKLVPKDKISQGGTFYRGGGKVSPGTRYHMVIPGDKIPGGGRQDKPRGQDKPVHR